jgi:cellobiose phosphorylase
MARQWQNQPSLSESAKHRLLDDALCKHALDPAALQSREVIRRKASEISGQFAANFCTFDEQNNQDQLTRAQCRRSPETTSRYWLP